MSTPQVDLAAAFDASWGVRGATAPQEEQANPQVDTAVRTERLTDLKGKRDRELAEIRDNHELTDQARNERTREARDRWVAAIEEEARDILQKIDEEDSRFERQLYRSPKPTDMGTELFLSRLRNEITDEIIAGSDPLEMYREAVRFDDQHKRRVLEKVAPPFLEDSEQRRQFEGLVAENEHPSRKKIRAKRAALAEERRSLELGFSLQGIRV